LFLAPVMRGISRDQSFFGNSQISSILKLLTRNSDKAHFNQIIKSKVRMNRMNLI